MLKMDGKKCRKRINFERIEDAIKTTYQAVCVCGGWVLVDFLL